MPKATKRKVPNVSPPEHKALQWEDMPATAQKDISRQMVRLGRAKSDVPAQRRRLKTAAANPEASEISQNKAQRRLLSQKALAPTFENTPITHEGAAEHRYSLVRAGVERSTAEDLPTGHHWYFEHNRRLSNVSRLTGHSHDAVVAASAVMSPQNNPEQELTSVTALAMAHADPNASVTIPKSLAREHPIFNDFAGRSVHPSQLTPHQMAHLSTVGVREQVQTSGNVNLDAMAKGGVKENVTKAIQVLRGHVAPHEAIDPRTSPKVWSYHKNIAEARWGTPEHHEFGRRMGSATGTWGRGEIAGQQEMQMFPELKGATHGILDPRGHTAEDTWQQAISTRQQLESVNIPGRAGRARRQSPAKFTVGEGGSANQKMLRSPVGMTGVGQSATMHAWQNRATQMAAERLSAESGEIIPAVGVQAGGWTEARRQAGKNIEEQTPVSKPGIPQPSLFNEDLTPSKRATTTPTQLRRAHERTAEHGTPEARRRSREFLAGGQMELF